MVCNDTDFFQECKDYALEWRMEQRRSNTLASGAVINFMEKEKTMTESLSFIPGKTYLNHAGERYFMIGKDDRGWMIARDMMRDRLTTVGTSGIWKEYKEPVVHKRYVHWLKNKETGSILIHPTSMPEPPNFCLYTHLHTQEITYTERSE